MDTQIKTDNIPTQLLIDLNRYFSLYPSSGWQQYNDFHSSKFVIPFNTSTPYSHATESQRPAHIKYTKKNLHQVERDSARYRQKARINYNREFYGRRNPNQSQSLSARPDPSTNAAQIQNDAVDRPLNPEVKPFRPGSVAVDLEKSPNPDDPASGGLPVIKEVTGQPKNDTQSVISKTKENIIPGVMPMDASDQKSVLPEIEPFSFLSSVDHDSNRSVPPKTPTISSGDYTSLAFRETSSPPVLKDGEVSCMFCEKLISDDDDMFLCKVCGHADCGCDANLSKRHRHPGFTWEEIWLGAETLSVFRKMHDI